MRTVWRAWKKASVGVVVALVCTSGSAIQVSAADDSGGGQNPALVIPGPGYDRSEGRAFEQAVSTHIGRGSLASGEGSIRGRNATWDVEIAQTPEGASASVVQVGAISEKSRYLTLSGGMVVDMVELEEEVDAHVRDGGMGMASVSGCNVLPDSAGWIRRADCLVYDSGPFLRAVWGKFYANYSVQTGKGRVDNVYAPSASCFYGAGAPTNQQLYITRKLSSGSTPARAVHSWTCKVGPITGNARHDLLVLTRAWSEVIE